MTRKDAAGKPETAKELDLKINRLKATLLDPTKKKLPNRDFGRLLDEYDRLVTKRDRLSARSSHSQPSR